MDIFNISGKSSIVIELENNGDFTTEFNHCSLAQAYATLRQVVFNLEQGIFWSEETEITDAAGNKLTRDEARRTIESVKRMCDKEFKSN